MWECLCECGTKHVVCGTSLRNGAIKSCGCLHREAAAIQGVNSRTHGMTGTRQYRVWTNMQSRCYNKNASSYRNYGARGIVVCDRWRSSFELFWEDMRLGYMPGLQIERKDVNGNYEPENCTWATPKEQARNTRQNILIDTPWGRMTIAEAADISGISQSTLVYRRKAGCDVNDMFRPLWKRKQAELKDRVKHVKNKTSCS